MSSATATDTIRTRAARSEAAGPATLAALLVILAGAAVPARALAESGPRLASLAHLSVHAGQRVEIRWTSGGETGELEILLSLDGGRHYPLRISPELDARAGRYVWRVPNLASREARLELRFESERGERTSEPGEPFVIEADADRPAERAQVAEGAWWQGLDEPRAADAAALGEARDPSLRAGRAALAAMTSPRDPLHPEVHAERSTFVSTAANFDAQAAPGTPGLTRNLPLRN